MVKRWTVRIAAVAAIGLGSVLAAGTAAQAQIVEDGCIDGNYWFVTDNGGGNYGWGVIYGSVKC